MRNFLRVSGTLAWGAVTAGTTLVAVRTLMHFARAWPPGLLGREGGLRVGWMLVANAGQGYVLWFVAPAAVLLLVGGRWRAVRVAGVLAALACLMFQALGIGRFPGCCICHPEWAESAGLLLFAAGIGLLRPRWSARVWRPGAPRSGPWAELPSGGSRG